MDKRHFVVSIIQTFIFFVTCFAAILIGHYQIKINQKIVDLDYMVSVKVTHSENQLHIHNMRKTNIYLCGTQIENKDKDIVDETVLITPGVFYYIPIDSLINKVSSIIGHRREMPINFNLFIENEGGERYIVRNRIIFNRVDGDLYIRTQTFSIIKSDLD